MGDVAKSTRSQNSKLVLAFAGVAASLYCFDSTKAKFAPNYADKHARKTAIIFHFRYFLDYL